MAYSQNLMVSARRHLHSASLLFGSESAGSQPGAKAVAGYLFGLSGELALKEIMRMSGMRPLQPADRRNDPFYAHFPELKTLLRDSAKGRRSGELRRLAENSNLFQNWDTEMRYAPTSEIQESWIRTWKQSAEELIKLMDSP